MVKIKIIFKSGAEITFKTKKFTVTREEDSIRRIQWIGSSPHIMHIDLEEVAAILEL